MKKLFILVAALVSFSAFSEVISLEDIIQAQTLTTISPLRYKGHPIVNTSGTDICSALGFKRFISAKTVRLSCPHQETYAGASLVSGMLQFNVFEVGYCGWDVNRTLFRLDEVVCAK